MVSKFVHTHECGPEPQLAGCESTCISVHKPKGRALFYFFIEVLLIYSVVFVSGVQQSDLVIHIYVCVCTHILLFRVFSMLSYYKILNVVPCAIQ